VTSGDALLIRQRKSNPPGVDSGVTPRTWKNAIDAFIGTNVMRVAPKQQSTAGARRLLLVGLRLLAILKERTFP
jgi:hypothetical protein